VRVGVGSLRSDGVNRAIANSKNGTSSNEARYAIRVDGGVFGDEACVIGAVYRDCNGNGTQDPGESGIAGARIYFSDGAFMVSDANGRYSMCGRTPTTHVLKIDTSTLPEGSVLLKTSNRNAGDPGSLFADLKNGELHRADFALSCMVTPPPTIEPLAPKAAVMPSTESKPPEAAPEIPITGSVTPPDAREGPTLCWDVMIEEVLFETDSAELTTASVDLLNGVIAQWRGRRDIALEVRGHTDSRASDLYNIRLSARRAKAVREFLLAGGGFDPAQLTESSYGESQPRDSNATPEGQARNRRVAIRVSGAFCKSVAPPSTPAQSVTGGN
jgi:outer membrane protein OmpA-like peptidoglycan-associated protein